MTNSLATAATINQRNNEFWNAQIQLMEQRTADPRLLEQAISDLDSESVRAVPIYNRMTFETALEQAVQAKERFHTRAARQGGQAAKTDPLGLRIKQLAMQNPTIHKHELWHQLRKEVGGGLIVIKEFPHPFQAANSQDRRQYSGIRVHKSCADFRQKRNHLRARSGAGGQTSGYG